MRTSPRSMTIGSLAKACDVSAPTIRYYEKIGLLPPAERNASDQRRYTPNAIKTLTFIRRCRDFGFSIQQTRDLVALSNSATNRCSQSRVLAQDRVTEIGAKIRELRALQTDLKALVHQCETTCIDGPATDCAPFTEMQMP